jgi:ATP-binding cassette subfamily B protein
MSGRTTIVIAHRPATIAIADTVVLLDEGCVAARGTHGELLATNQRYRDVLAAMDRQDDDGDDGDDGDDDDVDVAALAGAD